MSTPLIRRPDSNGASVQVAAAAPGLAEYGLPATARDLGAQASVVLGLLTGVWVALSPWFITLQNTGTNATIVNLISGLAVAGVAAFTLASPRGFAASAEYASVAQHYPMVAPGTAYYLITAGGILAALGIIAATFPLLARMTGPEVARNE